MKTIFLFIIILFQIKLFACEKEIIKVVWENFPPYQIGDISLNTHPKGSSVDLLLAAAKKIGCLKNIRFEYLPWKRGLFELEKGRVDIMFNALKTPEREKYAYYKRYYSKGRNAIFVSSKDYDKLSKLSSEELMKEKNFIIGYSNGYNYGKIFEKMLAKYPNKFEMALHDDLSIIKTSNNRVNAFIGDVIQTNELIKELKQNKKIDKKINFKFLSLLLDESPPFTYLMYSKKGMSEKLVNKFDDAFVQLYKEGTTKRIFLKYIPQNFINEVVVKPDFEK
ncbi:substrate-binding periplasmic protein [Fluviispira multicolorata]|uniref:Transporter substrate-binding domain-containing protein n=1 Tax=Fluviispira multicolorata TaxID=2654512 RepID=A0A833N613_9BACT|nr:transporter substrate-binding domain-containing protein [Fluviispira multicolorata]KAB8029139.1 transporter substrate-binding domain-containing protein [Fluviispira multicolorata]